MSVGSTWNDHHNPIVVDADDHLRFLDDAAAFFAAVDLRWHWDVEAAADADHIELGNIRTKRNAGRVERRGHIKLDFRLLFLQHRAVFYQIPDQRFASHPRRIVAPFTAHATSAAKVASDARLSANIGLPEQRVVNRG